MGRNKKKRKGTAGKVIIALMLIVVMLTVAWGIGCQITGELNPLNWGKVTEEETPAHAHEENGTAETITAPRLAFRTSGTDGSIDAEIELYAIESHPSRCPNCNTELYLKSRYYGDCQERAYEQWSCGDDENCGWGKYYYGTTNAEEHPKNRLNLTSETAATCVTTGTKHYTCTACGGTTTETIPATGNHSYAWIITTAPAGENAGVESYKCATCTSVKETRAVYALPAAPEKEGYHFIGWYKDEECTSPYDGDYIYADTNLYAKFEINSYTVTFDSDGGNAIESIITEWNTTITTSTPEKEGYRFIGWYTSDGEKYENQPIKGDTTLRARWEIIKFTVTFYVDGEIYTTKEVTYGSALAEILNEANRLNLVVMSVCNDKGAYIEDCAGVSITENYSIVVREMQGGEKTVNIIKNNLWYIIGGGIAFLGLCCGIGFAVSRKKGKA